MVYRICKILNHVFQICNNLVSKVKNPSKFSINFSYVTIIVYLGHVLRTIFFIFVSVWIIPK